MLIEGERRGQGDLTPDVRFVAKPQVELHLDLEGGTVHVRGVAKGEYETPCARCGEVAHKTETAEIDLVLKPMEGRDSKDEEDLHFGYYDGKEIDCAEIAEEFLVLNVPFVSFCRPDCKGLCPKCGADLNKQTCGCSDEASETSPFSVLKGLKLN